MADIIVKRRAATPAQIAKMMFEGDPQITHRSIYRGKNLGTSLTDVQKAAIANGTFDDLYVGDYWTINNRVYRIADIDYYFDTGDVPFTKHHLVIVPDANFGNGKMNNSNTIAGGYVGSLMYTDTTTPSVLNTARTTIATDFGDNLATHRLYLKNVVTSGYESGGDWFDSTVDLMSEIMVYGHRHYGNVISNTAIPDRNDVECRQLALFELSPKSIHQGRYIYWLRDVVSSANFAAVNLNGAANSGNASNSRGVRPFFLVIG